MRVDVDRSAGGGTLRPGFASHGGNESGRAATGQKPASIHRHSIRPVIIITSGGAIARLALIPITQPVKQNNDRGHEKNRVTHCESIHHRRSPARKTPSATNPSQAPAPSRMSVRRQLRDELTHDESSRDEVRQFSKRLAECGALRLVQS
jgi:hypothetical protein